MLLKEIHLKNIIIIFIYIQKQSIGNSAQKNYIIVFSEQIIMVVLSVPFASTYHPRHTAYSV